MNGDGVNKLDLVEFITWCLVEVLAVIRSCFSYSLPVVLYIVSSRNAKKLLALNASTLVFASSQSRAYVILPRFSVLLSSSSSFARFFLFCDFVAAPAPPPPSRAEIWGPKDAVGVAACDVGFESSPSCACHQNISIGTRISDC